MAKPLTDTERQAITDLLTAHPDLPIRELARRSGRSTDTIRRIAHQIGHVFSREKTETATRARQVDLAARRAELAAQLVADAARLRAQLWEPCVERKAMAVAQGGNLGSVVEVVEVHHPRPPFADQQRIMTCVGIAVDKVLAIDRHDNQADEGLAAVDRWLREMIGEAVG